MPETTHEKQQEQLQFYFDDQKTTVTTTVETTYHRITWSHMIIQMSMVLGVEHSAMTCIILQSSSKSAAFTLQVASLKFREKIAIGQFLFT